MLADKLFVAVNRQHQTRPKQLVHVPDFLFAAMAGSVNQRVFVGNYVNSLGNQLFLHFADFFFIAGDDLGRKNNRVAFAQFDIFALIVDN